MWWKKNIERKKKRNRMETRKKLLNKEKKQKASSEVDSLTLHTCRRASQEVVLQQEKKDSQKIKH